MRRAALYTRATTSDEHCDAYINELRQFAECHGLEIVREFKDTTRHDNTNHPELEALLAAAKRSQFDLVLVWRCDLIARSISYFLELLQTLNEYGIAFISVQDSFDTSGPLGQAVRVIISVAMELDRNLAAERVRAGLRRARSAGRQLGRKRLTVDLAALQLDRARGLSLSQLARRYGLSRTTVARALRRADDVSLPANPREPQSRNPCDKKE